MLTVRAVTPGRDHAMPLPCIRYLHCVSSSCGIPNTYACVPSAVRPPPSAFGHSPLTRGHGEVTIAGMVCAVWTAKVEDLSREAEVKPRKSKPDLNSVQLSLPQHMRQLPIAAARQKGGGRGGNGDKADCQPRWQGADKPAEPLVIRVTLDGGRESEQEACKLINDAGREYGRRRAGLKLRVAALLELRQTCFSPSNALHTQQLTDLWHLALGDGAPSPPSCMPADGARSEGCAAPDWGNLGFQNRLCPQSDFRDMGMLSGAFLNLPSPSPHPPLSFVHESGMTFPVESLDACVCMMVLDACVCMRVLSIPCVHKRLRPAGPICWCLLAYV